ncbi:hypothetical protein ALP11_05692 [Pseudomonas syringae pv. papulans]|nr:hypothetical protein ALP11_05692 [Pseudomonas syringae pv. papulans]
MSGQRNRHHEQRSQRQIGREHPFGEIQVLRLDVLDHRHVELTGQADNRHHRHAGLHEHRRPVDRVFPVFLEAWRQFGLIEQVVESVVQAERDEHTDCHESEQLDQRLESNGQHHAAMVFGDIQIARTEDDGEQRENQRHPQRGVLSTNTGGIGHGTDQDIHPQHDAFELQRDVRQHADQADQRHHDCEGLGFAIARRDEVGDRGDVFLFADQHHFLQHPGCQYHQHDGPQVDRQERPQLLGGLTHCAEKRPAGAVDRQRQAVDPGAHGRAQRRAVAVAVKGDSKHDGHIGQGNGRNQPAGQRHIKFHTVSITRSLARWLRFVFVDQGRAWRGVAAAPTKPEVIKIATQVL